MPKQKNMPESVNQISWVRAQEMKVGRGVCPGEGLCLPRGGVVSAQGRGCVCPGGVSTWGVSAQGGVSAHHAFDVTCMLSLYQLRLKSSAAAYIVLVM